jgi:hypothetical protein
MKTGPFLYDDPPIEKPAEDSFAELYRKVSIGSGICWGWAVYFDQILSDPQCHECPYHKYDNCYAQLTSDSKKIIKALRMLDNFVKEVNK